MRPRRSNFLFWLIQTIVFLQIICFNFLIKAHADFYTGAFSCDKYLLILWKNSSVLYGFGIISLNPLR